MKILVLFTFFSVQVFAQLNEFVIENSFTSNQERFLQNQIKLDSIIIDAIKDIELIENDFKDIEKANTKIKNMIQQTIELSASQNQQPLTPETKLIVSQYITKLSFKEQLRGVSNFIRNQGLNAGAFLTQYARRSGLQTAIFFMAMVQVNYTLPAFMLFSGNPALLKLSVALLAAPLTSVGTGAFTVLSSQIRNIQLVRKFGLSKVINHLEITKKIKKFVHYNFFKNDFIAKINIQGANYTLNIKESLLTRLINKAFKTTDLNYEALYIFLRQENKFISEISLIDSTKKSRFSKTIKLIQLIENSEDGELVMRLKRRFQNNFNFFNKNIPEIYHSWFFNLSQAKTLDEVFIKLKNMPNDIPGSIFKNAWKKFVLPELAANFQGGSIIGSYKSFRNLYNMFDKEITPILIGSNDQYLPSNFKKVFDDYLFKALYPSGSCTLPYKGIL